MDTVEESGGILSGGRGWNRFRPRLQSEHGSEEPKPNLASSLPKPEEMWPAPPVQETVSAASPSDPRGNVSARDGGKSLRGRLQQRPSAGFSANVCGDGGSIRGVRAGLGFLIMGDVARAYVSHSNYPTLYPPSGFRQEGSGRVRGRDVRSTTYAQGNGDFVNAVGVVVKGTGLRAPREGILFDGRRGLHRRRQGGHAASSLRCTSHQQQQDCILTSQRVERVSGVPPSIASSRSALASLPGTGAAAAPRAREIAAPKSTTARTKATMGRVVRGAWKRVGASPARLGATLGTSAAGVGGGGGGGRGNRLGVIKNAVGGGTAGKKVKVKALYFQARDLLKRSPPAFLEAIKILEEALNLDAEDGHSWLLLAKTLERRGRVDAARDAFKRATAACPENVHLWQSWGMLEDKFGDLAMARRLFANGLEADPGNPFVCHAWGLMEQRDGDMDKARGILKSSRPKAAIASALGELEATRGDLEGARREFQKGLACLEKARGERASSRRKPGDWEAAEDPAEILVAWARLEEQLGGDLDRATQLLEKAQEGDPYNVKIHIERARFEMRRGDMNSARLILSRAANLPQKAGNLFNMWATLETKEGNFDTALKIAKAATDRFPQDKSLLQTLGTVHGKLGQHAQAIECYRRSIAVRPAAPAYVAWALIVAKLADRAARKQSSKSAEEASDDDGDDFRLLEDDNVHASRRVGTARALLADGIFNGDAATSGSEYSTESSVLMDLAPTTPPFSEASDDVRGQAAPSNTLISASTSVTARGSESSGRRRRGGRVVEGKRAEDEASYQEARRIFELGIAADPAHGPLYNAYGTMEAKIGNVDHARDVYERGIAARCCGMASVWQGLGALEASAGNQDRARKIFARGIRESSDDVSFLFHSLGSLELNAFRLEDARVAFTEGIGRYPNSTQLLLGAALTETRMANIDEARDLFRRAVQADPSHAHAWQAWGLMESRLGNYEIARSLWESGLKACPLHGPLWQAYAVMEESLGEQERARKLFRAGLERCPEHVQLHQAWAVMEGKAGDLPLARQLVLDGLRADPYHGALWTVYAIIERQQGSDAKARKVMELGTRACPKHGSIFRSWGQMEFQSGNIAESRRVFERGLKACPTYARLYYAYGDVEASLGNLDSLEELTLRGKEALLSKGVSPRELQEFDAQMQAFAALARFDVRSTWEDRHTASDVFDVD